jgi:integrase
MESRHDTPSTSHARGHAGPQSQPEHQKTYLLQVALFARHFSQSPHLLGQEQIRRYQVYLTNEKRLSPKSVLIATAALRFLYGITLKKSWDVELAIPLPKKPQTLPVVLRPEEVRQFLGCVPQRKARTVLTVCYAAGLRISEAIALKPADLDSQRMTIRIAQGKGQKDRYVMLSEQLLVILREWYRFARPKTWLFPVKRLQARLTALYTLQSCLPALLELSGGQAIIRVTGGVAPLGQRCLVARLLQLQLDDPALLALLFLRGQARRYGHRPRVAARGRADRD